MHNIDAAYLYRCLGVLWSVCLCLLVTTVKSVIPAKTDLQIYIPFGVYVDSDGRNERCAVTVYSWSVQINNVFWYAQKVSGPEASERRGRSPPQCWNHWGESIFSPPQYFPPHFCMLFLKLPLFVVMLQKILTQKNTQAYATHKVCLCHKQDGKLLRVLWQAARNKNSANA